MFSLYGLMHVNNKDVHVMSRASDKLCISLLFFYKFLFEAEFIHSGPILQLIIHQNQCMWFKIPQKCFVSCEVGGA